ncbi:MAG: hypothetical protein K2M40_07545 [Muribaculaceae bacterium]|nr:hypothetical protein [Muribaculaceae bacterium]
MKKITLFAVAALAASQAFAVVPGAANVKNMRSDWKLQSSSYLKKADLSKPVVSRAESDEVPSTEPTYYSKGAMYLGLDAAFYEWRSEFGFVSGNSFVNFVPVEKYDGYEWEWAILGRDENIPGSSTEDILTIETVPFMQFSGPTLKGSTAGVTTTYNDSVSVFFGGGNPEFYGFNSFDGSEIGMSHYGKITGVGSTLEISIDKTQAGTDDYNANGTCTEIDSVFVSLDPKQVAMTGYGSILEGMNQPFLLKGAYIYVIASTKAAIPLDITVYALNEEGKIDTKTILGRGEAVLPAGEFNDFLTFDVEAVLPELPTITTGAPVVVPTTGAYISITGMNVDDLLTFNVVFNRSLSVDRAQWTQNNETAAAAYRKKMQTLYPSHAIFEVDVTGQDDEVQKYYYGDPWLYSNSSTPTELWLAREYCIYFIVDLPVLSNATQGFEQNDMTIELPVDGGQTNRFFESTQDIMQLIEDEYVTVEEEGTDWLEFLMEADEDYPEVFNFIVAADALPEGVKGRKATFTLTGYGYDNTITVTQGDPDAAISEIVANKAKQGKVFDLQGRAVKNATKGIYIVDGVKTIL